MPRKSAPTRCTCIRGSGFFKNEAQRIFQEKIQSAVLSPETLQRAKNVLERAIIKLKEFGSTRKRDMSDEEVRDIIDDYTDQLNEHARRFPVEGYRYVDEGRVNGMRNWIADGEEILRQRRAKGNIINQLRLQLAILVRSEHPRIVPADGIDVISGELIRNGDMMYDVDRMYYNPSPNFFRADGIDNWYEHQQERGLPFLNPVTGIPIAVLDKYIAQVGPDRPTTFNFKTTPKKTTLQKLSGKMAGLFGRAPPAREGEEGEDISLLTRQGEGRRKRGVRRSQI